MVDRSEFVSKAGVQESVMSEAAVKVGSHFPLTQAPLSARGNSASCNMKKLHVCFVCLCLHDPVFLVCV